MSAGLPLCADYPREGAWGCTHLANAEKTFPSPCGRGKGEGSARGSAQENPVCVPFPECRRGPRYLRSGSAIHARLPARNPSPFPFPQGEGKKKEQQRDLCIPNRARSPYAQARA
jgi:hypothetical protein